MRRWGLLVMVAVAAVFSVSCGSESPSTPSPVAPATSARSPLEVAAALEGDNGTAVRGQNNRPTLVYRTTPAARPGEPYPVISGRAPFTVRFNLCRSTDSDAGDSLNWQFHFGDSGSEPFNSDGTFNADFARVCRAEHTYQEGSYVATLSVTDKHLEDQGGDVAAAARVIQRLTISVLGRDAGGSSDALTLLASQSTALTTGGSFTNSAFGGFFSPAVSEAVAQSATKVVVTVVMTTNTYTSIKLGIADAAGTTPYLAGAPKLVGTGTFTYELTPGQFAGSVSLTGISITTESGGGSFFTMTVDFFG